MTAYKQISVSQCFNHNLDQNKDYKSDYKVMIRGWVSTIRKSKKIAFINVNDGSCVNSIQCIIESSNSSFGELGDFSTGSCVKIIGYLVNSPSGKRSVELSITNLHLLASVSQDYPLQKKYHSAEYLREIAHLRSRSRMFSSMMRLRNQLSMATHSFFDKKQFLLVHTPIISASDCEGAGETFQVTNLDLDKITSSNSYINYKKDFFHKKAYLSVSGQLQAEYLCLGLGNVYTFGPTFRAENSQTRRHLAEFWMIEPEMAFYDLQDCMKLATEHFNYIIKRVLEHCKEDMEYFCKNYSSNSPDYFLKISETVPENITYCDAIKILKPLSGKKYKSKFDPNYEIVINDLFWGQGLNSDHERFLCEIHFERCVFVRNYPKKCKSFYMKVNDDDKTVACMDFLVPGIGELIGGSQREHRYDVLKSRMQELNVMSLDWYLELRKYGCPEHSGYGMGIERMLMYLSSVSNIRDTIPSPRTPGNIRF